MIKFNSEEKADLTIGEIGDTAMKIQDKEEALEYLTDYSRWIMEKSEKELTEDEAIDIAASNLGYYSGYYSHEERMVFQEIFGIEHPIFGSKTPTAEEAFQMGVNFSKSI